MELLEIQSDQRIIGDHLNIVQGTPACRRRAKDVHRRNHAGARVTGGAVGGKRPPVAAVKRADPAIRILNAAIALNQRVLSRTGNRGTAPIDRKSTRLNSS